MDYRGYTIPQTKEGILELDAKVNDGASAVLWQDDKFGPSAIATCITVIALKEATDPTELVNAYVADVKKIIDYKEDVECQWVK